MQTGDVQLGLDDFSQAAILVPVRANPNIDDQIQTVEYGRNARLHCGEMGLRPVEEDVAEDHLGEKKMVNSCTRSELYTHFIGARLALPSRKQRIYVLRDGIFIDGNRIGWSRVS